MNIITTGYNVSRTVSLIRRHSFAFLMIILIRNVFAKSAENVIPKPITSSQKDELQARTQ